MLLSEALLPSAWLWSAHFVYALILLWTLWRMPWSYMLKSANHNVLFGLSVILLLLWTFKAGTGLDPRVHLLGATAFALMFGWEMAIAGMSLVLLGVTLNGGSDWMAFSANMLLSAVVPVWLSYQLFRLVERRLPHHFFVYIFVTAFLGGALAYASSALLAYGVLSLVGTSPDNFFERFLPVVLLLMFAEAWVNGMAVTVFVVMKPKWVVTFDDAKYLLNK